MTERPLLRCPKCGSRFVAQRGVLVVTKNNIGTLEAMLSTESSRTDLVLSGVTYVCDNCGWESDLDPWEGGA